jgi:ribosome-binding protein aMBF1 (putative translation factor)
MIESAMKERSVARTRPMQSVGHSTDDPRAFAASVGEGVRRARQARGWTQVQLAEAAGLSPNYVARLERGELGPSFFVANQLCESLGIDVNELLHPVVPPARTTRRRLVG